MQYYNAYSLNIVHISYDFKTSPILKGYSRTKDHGEVEERMSEDTE